MSSINGTYVNSNADASLVVTDGNDPNGSFSGELTQAGVKYSVTGHYHFQNNSGQPTTISFSAYNFDYGYQAWALFSSDHKYGRLRALGARTNFSGDVVGLSGEFLRQ
ncbi:hypothetical protein BLX41_13430 [Pseudomonas protegens]|uniref:hypothetical protein n=1 Tax=Pseudomonas protegens TaxID=380021 RepID=UPI000F4B933F|nr:hypothetical protein [Pseudomonas protegens]ROL76872.1 hypothetical protein BLX41_13430 [Pseudomonas protegens]